MKNLYYKIFLFFAFFILNFIFLIPHCQCQWMQTTNGMGNRTIYTLTYNGNNIFAGTAAYGVYLSTNNGSNWTQTPLNNQFVPSLAVNANTIFAGTFSSSNGVYLSTNNGTYWTQTGLNNQDVFSLATNGNYIYAGTQAMGVYFSTNNGTNWTHTPLNHQIDALVINGNYIFAGTDTYGVYFSTDSGTTWAQTSLNNQTVLAFAINGNNIFAGSGGSGVYLSINNGTSWSQTSLNNQYIYSLAINGNNIFAGTGGSGVYVSVNNGTSWSLRNENLGELDIYALCILNNYIFAGTLADGVFRRPLSELIGIQLISEQNPSHYALYQNYPNPFNPATKIKFDMPTPLNPPFGQRGDERSGGGLPVKLSVFDLRGKEVITLVNEQLNPGTHEVSFDGSNFSSGIYYYSLIVDNTILDTKKLVLLK